MRPTNPKKINLDDLLPGDILLSAGSNLLDQIILLIDQGDYTHTTQYVGKIDGVHMVVEATKKGIKYQSITADLTQDLVDAYRYVSPDGASFGNPDWPVKPVIDQALSFQGSKYAYSELLMAAVILLASEVPSDKNLNIIVRLELTAIESMFEKWLTDNANKTPMTCVEVVTSAHWMALANPANKYGIQVKINGDRNLPFKPSKNQETYHDFRNKIMKHMQFTYPIYTKKLMEDVALLATAGSKTLPLGSCTLRDMQTSPSLQFIGCIKDKRS
jgi:hypothetical protein